MSESEDKSAGKTPGSDEAAEARAFDLLLDSFAARYVFPWELRELGRVDSPLDLRPQLDEARELFDRARSRWNGFDMFAWGAPAARSWDGALRDFDGGLWDRRTVEAAREAHQFLLTHTAYDLSRPDDLYLADLQEWLSEHVPKHVLWASVAMCCVVDAADECYRISLIVEEVALRDRKVKLSELYATDNDRWFDQVHDVLRDPGFKVAECRVYIATYLAAARAALVLASFADSEEALHEVEVLNADLRAVIAAKDIKLNVEMCERIAVEKAAEQRRAQDRLRQQAGARANAQRAKKTAETVRELWQKYSSQYPSDDQLCQRIADDIESPRSKPGAPVFMSKDAIRKIARRLGLLHSQKGGGVSESPLRDSNKETQT